MPTSPKWEKKISRSRGVVGPSVTTLVYRGHAEINGFHFPAAWRVLNRMEHFRKPKGRPTAKLSDPAWSVAAACRRIPGVILYGTDCGTD